MLYEVHVEFHLENPSQVVHPMNPAQGIYQAMEEGWHDRR